MWFSWTRRPSSEALDLACWQLETDGWSSSSCAAALSPKTRASFLPRGKVAKQMWKKCIFLVDDDDDDDYRHWTLRTDCFVGHCFAYMFCMSKFYLLVDFLDMFGDTKSPVMTNFAGCPVLIVLLHLQHLVLSTKMFKEKTPWKLTPKRPTRNEK